MPEKQALVFRIKICGVTTSQDAHAVADAGADAIGLNFYEKSSRYVEPQNAAEVVKDLPSSVKRVGVFVNAPLDRIQSCCQAAMLHVVQLHGDESTGFAKSVIDQTGLPVMRAFRAKTGDESRVAEYVDDCPGLAAVLIDAAIAGQFGGTGHIGDWEFVATMVGRLKIPVILAGGLNPTNVAAAIKATGADGVDTASGVESAPGNKNVREIQEFVVQAKKVRL
ncbi:MAG: phosphoribosylanthranilate isomerase [Planctomycetota bacterium]